MDLAEILLPVAEALHLEDPQLEAVFRPPAVVGRLEGFPEAGDPLVTLARVLAGEVARGRRLGVRDREPVILERWMLQRRSQKIASNYQLIQIKFRVQPRDF